MRKSTLSHAKRALRHTGNSPFGVVITPVISHWLASQAELQPQAFLPKAGMGWSGSTT
jgi:hypothetical protein